jgi:23S rRNA (adenine2503-C2)-methyltransferase
MDLELLARTLDSLGEPRFRGGQVWSWAAGGASGYDEMTNVPAALRASLASSVPFSSLTLVDEAHARDGTVKALFETGDGRPVEAVLMRFQGAKRSREQGAERPPGAVGRRSVCVSSQSGCPLTCSFCATGSMKFGRNLSASEILDQVLHFRRIEPVDHLVFMGMGEPLMNVEAVLAAAARLPDIGITHRRTTVSTVGWLPGLEAFAECGMPLRLAFSLHAPDDELRSRIMPVNDRYPMADVLEACRAHFERTNRAVFIESVMLAGVNDAPAQARALASLLGAGRCFKVNLIPYNPTGLYEGSPPGAIAAFKAILEEHGVHATVRLTRGRDIAAACGQLAAAGAG